MDETEAPVVELDELEFDEFVVEFSKSASVVGESKELRSEASEDVEPMISP
jgi:hypothetical protein